MNNGFMESSDSGNQLTDEITFYSGIENNVDKELLEDSSLLSLWKCWVNDFMKQRSLMKLPEQKSSKPISKPMEPQDDNDKIETENKSDSPKIPLSLPWPSYSKNGDNNLRVFGTAEQKHLPTDLNENGKSGHTQTDRAQLNNAEDIRDADCSEVMQPAEHWWSTRDDRVPMTTYDEVPEQIMQRNNFVSQNSPKNWPLIRPMKKENNRSESRQPSKGRRQLKVLPIFNTRIDSKHVDLKNNLSLPRRNTGTTCETREKRNAKENSNYTTDEYLEYCDDEENEVPFLQNTFVDDQPSHYEDNPDEEIRISSIHQFAPFQRYRDLEVYNDPIMRDLESLKELIGHKQEEYKRRYTRELDTLQKYKEQLSMALTYI